ncbi:hypothetical protein ACTFIV_008687 [Dictyostelium citrinum]
MDYIKSKLKEAREAIDKKDYKTALENCNEIVQYDDKNYMIHLFLGVSNFNLNNLTAAEKSYNTAFKLQKIPAPLRGLVELYNRTNENDKLSNTLKELIPLTSDEQKKKETIFRLIEISGILKDYKTTIDFISPILFENEKSRNDDNEQSKTDRIKLLEKFEEANYQYYLNTLKTKIDEKLREKNIPIVDYSKSHVLGAIQHTPEQKQERDKIEFELNKSLINNFNLKVYEELLSKNNMDILTNEQMIRIYTHFIQILIGKRRIYSSEENKDEEKQKQLRKEIKENCERMNELLSTPIYSLETLINLLEEQFDFNDDDDDIDGNDSNQEAVVGLNNQNNQLYEKINEISTTLTNKYPNRGLGWIGLGFYKVFKLKDYSEQSKQLIEKGFSNAGSTDSLLGYLALSKWYLKVENHERVRDIVKKSMIVYDQKQKAVGGADYFNNIFIKLQLILVESLSFNCNFELASSLLESLIKKFPIHFNSLTFSQSKLNFYSIKDYKKSKELFESIVNNNNNNNNSNNSNNNNNDINSNDNKLKNKKIIELSNVYLVWLKILLKESKESLIKSKDRLKEIIELNGETGNDYLNYYVYGLILIELNRDGGVESCSGSCDDSFIIQQFLKSAKLNSNHSDTFAKLGTLYKKIGQKERSKKCYQKSLQLDILNGEAGFELGEIYAESGQTSLVMSLYKEITDFCLSPKQIKRFPINVVKCSWAFYRLAIYQMDNKDIHNSVVSLLNAIKGEPLNESYWRTLAEAYRRQFKYVAALKSLKKAEEILDNENRIATDINFQIATLSKTLGLYDDAINEYDRVLKQLENNVPSLKGKAECLLQLSIEQYKFRNFRQSLIHLQLAESSIKIALEKENNFHSLWRLYADISSYFLNLPNDNDNNNNNNNYDYLIEKSKQSSNAYFNCVRIHSNAHSLQDLSIGYYNQYIIYKNYLKQYQQEKNLKVTKEETENLLKSSIKCVVEALNLSPSDPMLWNLLGVVLMDKFPAQSQHALIRSIQLDSSKSEPYNNLTLLYFEYGFIEQSDKSLMIAKNNNIDSIISWSLQGLINEVKSSNNNNNNSNKDNNSSTGREDYNYIDNALESSPIGQGLLGYGITSLLEGYSETSYSVLYKYVELNPNSIEGNNSLALVYSHQNDYENSEKHFKSALNLLSNSKTTTKNSSNNNESKITLNNNNSNCSIGSILFSDKPLNDGIEFSNDEKLKYVKINLSRTQYHLGKFDEALETIKPYITTTIAATSEPSLSNSILFELVSLIYCKLNKLNESIDAMKKAISQIPKSLETATIRKKNLLYTLAKIQYSCSGGNKQIDTIVKTLEAIISIDKRFYKAWYYLAAVYIDCGKNDLAKNVLIKLQTTVEQLESNSYLLLSKIHLLNNEIEEARKQLQKLIHLFPLDPIGWTSLAELEMKYFINNNNNNNNNNHSSSNNDPCNLPLSLLNHSLNKKQHQEYSGMGQLSVGPDHKVLQPPTIKELEIIAKANLYDLQSPWTKCLDNAIVIMKRIIHSNPLSKSNNNIQPWIHLQNLLYWRSLYTDNKEDWESTKSCWNVVQYLTLSTTKTTTEDFKFQQILIELEFKLALSIISEGDSTTTTDEFDKLISNYQKQTNFTNEKKSVLLSLEAKKYLRQGDKVKALSILKEALKLEPNSIPTYHNLSDIYQSNDQLDASLLCLNRSLLILKQQQQQQSSLPSKQTITNNNNGLILTTLSKIIRNYCIQKKFKEALKLLEENLSNNNYLDNPVIKLLKGILIIGSSKLTNNNLKQFTNDMKNALNLLEESSTINSKLSLTNFYSAVVQFNLKNFNLSDGLLQKELNLTPSLSLQINSLQEKIKQFTK